MEQERTYGVEMELTSTLSKEEMADQLNMAFREATTGHRCIATSFVRNSDGRNFVNWTAKTDSTIHVNPDYPSYRHGVELVSPVLKGEGGLDHLRVACAAIGPFVKVNKSCGLHVHHGARPEDNLGNILMAWVKAEKVIYECLPLSRKTGSYAAPIASKIRETPPTVTYGSVGSSNFKRWLEDRMSGRYWGLNLQSLWLRGTFEIRCAAGTHEFEKIANWLRVTQRLIVKGSVFPAAFEGVRNAEDLTERLAAAVELAEREELVERAVHSVRTGRANWMPNRTSYCGYAFHRLLESPEPLSRRTLAREMVEHFGIQGRPGTSAELWASSYISRTISRDVPRSGCVVRKLYRDRLKIELPGIPEVHHVTERVVHPAVNLGVADSPADMEAWLWLQRRHARFQQQHRGF